MGKPGPRTVTQNAAERLRAIVLSAPEGALIGSEDLLVSSLECSRSTVRQVARILEREGLIKVRRGLNGGYFGARPDAETIVGTVSAHLDALNVDPHDATVIASALWVVAVRKAARASRDKVQAMVKRWSSDIRSLPDDASYSRVSELELAYQREVFALAESPYIRMIFDVNATFSTRHIGTSAKEGDLPATPDTAVAWREAKLMELNAIASGNEQLASAAAQHSRNVWFETISRRYARLAGGRV